MEMGKGMTLLRDDDPRSLAVFNRIRDLVRDEVLHQSWGVALWGMERLKHISREMRQAGDEYFKLANQYKRAMAKDEVDDFKRHDKIKKRWAEAVWLLGRDRWAVDELVFEEMRPTTEAGIKRVRNGLGRLEIFFRVGNKK